MPPPARFKSVALDAVDHQALADWWCGALGYERRSAPEGVSQPPEWPVLIHDPTGSGPLIWLMPVPEGTAAPEGAAGKSRLHFDLYGSVKKLVAHGARLLREHDEEITWDILADPNTPDYQF